EPDETRNLIINFSPDDAQVYNGELTIYSDDPDAPETAIQLTGRGVNSPPDIYLGYRAGEGPELEFTEHVIAANFDGADALFAVDLDRDGDADLLAAAYDADDISWWENDGNENFTAHTIVGDYDGAAAVYALDLDQDGDVDVLGAAGNDDDISWWENDGAENFTAHTITGGAAGAASVHAADLDGDGDVDVVGAAEDGDEITWWENDGYENFTEHIITDLFDGACFVRARDVDGDGDIDLIGAARMDDDLAWWENNGDRSFTEHTIAGDFDGASSVHAVDLDGDGDVDLLAAAEFADDVAWWENDGDEGFTMHTIAADFDGAVSVYGADVDGDGDIDVLGAATEGDDATWWENDGDESFTEHTIAPDFDGSAFISAQDIDEDLDMDLLGAATEADDVTWWENAREFGHDFGEVEKDSTDEWTFLIHNQGDQLLTVSDVTSTNGAFTADFEGSIDIDPGTSTQIAVSFMPVDYQSYNGTLEIDSNDPDESTVIVQLSGEGIFVNYPPEVESPIPDLALEEDFDPYIVADLDTVFSDPNEDDLSYIAISDRDEVTVEIINNSELRIDSDEDWFGDAQVTVTADDGYEGGGPAPRRDNGPVRRLRRISAGRGSESVSNGMSLISAGRKSGYGRDERGLRSIIDASQGGGINPGWAPRRDDTEEMIFDVAISAVNDEPVWDSVPDSTEIDESEELTFTVEASDIDGDDLTLDASSADLPGGWNFTDNNDGTGTFVWTPGYDDSGDYTLTVTVSDAEFDVAEDIDIAVNHVNRAPAWDDVPESVSVDEAEEL
ncbi:MAG TPA: choice-of-anchor D domain-containing protein, partial [Bacteroidetes bacterium]|nr:choice-of-anchor D domain-containing protein [Bacteroidota bacterium]